MLCFCACFIYFALFRMFVCFGFLLMLINYYKSAILKYFQKSKKLPSHPDMFSDGQVADGADGVFLGFRGRWFTHHLQNVAQKVSRQQLYLGEDRD